MKNIQSIIFLCCFIFISTSSFTQDNSLDIGIFNNPLNSNKLEIRLKPNQAINTFYTGGKFTIRYLIGSSINLSTFSNPFGYGLSGSGNDGVYEYRTYNYIPGIPPTVTWNSGQEVVILVLQINNLSSTPVVFEIVTNSTWTIDNGGNYYQELNSDASVGAQNIIYQPSTGSVVLPVELLSFKATKNQGKTLIEWEAVQEKNLSNYIIERSDDGKNFKPLGFEKPKAKSEVEKTAYSFVDDQPEIGINYYRLQSKGVRKEDFKYSKVVSVDFGLGLKAKAFPNPFAAELSIEIDIEQGVKGEVTIDMFDTAGKQVLTKKLNAEGRKLNFDVPTEGLVPGSYVIRVKNGSYTWQHKITKQ
jgi:hypothetical protein